MPPKPRKVRGIVEKVMTDLALANVMGAMRAVLGYAQSEQSILNAAAAADESEAMRMELHACDEAVAKAKAMIDAIAALQHDPIDLLRRVMKASAEGQIKGLYGPLHNAIERTLSGASTEGILTEYRLLVIHGDVEPELHGEAHAGYESVLQAAIDYRQNDDQDLSDGIYVVKVPAGASVEVLAFCGVDLDPSIEESE